MKTVPWIPHVNRPLPKGLKTADQGGFGSETLPGHPAAVIRQLQRGVAPAHVAVCTTYTTCCCCSQYDHIVEGGQTGKSAIGAKKWTENLFLLHKKNESVADFLKNRIRMRILYIRTNELWISVYLG